MPKLLNMKAEERSSVLMLGICWMFKNGYWGQRDSLACKSACRTSLPTSEFEPQNSRGRRTEPAPEMSSEFHTDTVAREKQNKY